MPSDWARPLRDPAAFRDEQQKLATLWTFVGFTWDAPRDGDWFRTSLATRSIFVQRFGDELRAFENRCAHRFMPLRTAGKGNGPIVCGFHGWRYDENGSARGIPACRENFAGDAASLGKSLVRLQLETCGTLVFARYPSPQRNETLKDFLREGFPILEAMSQSRSRPRFLGLRVAANWRLCAHISMDDYHSATVHPGTFGKSGYLKRKDIAYRRFGLHSAFFTTNEPDALENMAEACQRGTFVSSNYRILQLMPNLAVAHFRSDEQFWYCIVLQYLPLRHDLTEVRAWFHPAPFPARHAAHVRWTRWLTDPFRHRIVGRYIRKVLREDNEVCERMQGIAHQFESAPSLGALEERIGWFEEGYRSVIAGAGPASVPPPAP